VPGRVVPEGDLLPPVVPAEELADPRVVPEDEVGVAVRALENAPVSSTQAPFPGLELVLLSLGLLR